MARIVAEIGCNHKGDMEIAHEMIKMSAMFCNADIVKFQKRNPKELLSEEEYDAPHPEPYHSYGNTYGEHREFLEFDKEQHKQLMKWCKKWEIDYSVSVWDLTSAKEMTELSPKFLKVPSACNLDWKLLQWLIDNYKGEIHISFGMTTKAEEEQIISLFEKFNRNKDLVIYSCTSGYPVPFEDICLLELKRLSESYSNRVKTIGFSGHHLGIAADVAALAQGATIFERHFTLDRTWKGTDHAASLEPDGLRRLTRDIKNVEKSLTYKSTEILEIEKIQRNKLKRNI